MRLIAWVVDKIVSAIFWSIEDSDVAVTVVSLGIWLTKMAIGLVITCCIYFWVLEALK